MKKISAILLAIIITLGCGLSVFANDGQNALKNTILISADSEKKQLSKTLYGVNLDDSSCSIDGGLSSNLVYNNSFEYKNNNTLGWKCDNQLAVDNIEPMNDNNPTYAVLDVNTSTTIENTSDMGFFEGVEYEFSCYLKNDGFDGSVYVYLNGAKNKSNVIELDTTSVGSMWTKICATLTSSADENGSLAIMLSGSGKICIDSVSLVAKNSYGYNEAGWSYSSLRPDLYQAVERLSPSFIRFYATPKSTDGIIEWKNTIGSVEERLQFTGADDSEGTPFICSSEIGVHEYLSLCRDLSAVAIPVFDADTPLQEIKDFISYANGNSTTSYWGSLRSINGSEKPFKIKNICIENLGDYSDYQEKFDSLYKSIKQSYPKLNIISGSELDESGKVPSQINALITDTAASEFLKEQSGKSGLLCSYRTETDKPITGSDLKTAVQLASFYTAIEQSGAVKQAYYSPLFSKAEAQSNSSIAWFNARELALAPSYYVSQIYSNNTGTSQLYSTFENGMFTSNNIYESVTIDEAAQIIYVKLANTSGSRQTVNLSLDGYDVTTASVQSVNGRFASACNKLGKTTTVAEEYSISDNNGNISVELDSYDASVVRIAYGEKDNFYKLPPLISTVEQNISAYIPPMLVLFIAIGAVAIVIIAIAGVFIIKGKGSKRE